jgi:hypothetical protein
MWECDRFLGCGDAIAKRSVGIAIWDVGDAIAFGMWEMWECDRCISKHLTYQLI